MKARARSAFTAFDVVVSLATLFLLMALFILAQRSARVGCGGATCASNQKQIALAFRMWSNDHGDKFPMSADASACAGNPIPSFLMISNELTTPKLLFCPQDRRRGPRALAFEALTTNEVSYSIGIDASETNAASLLLTDRNVALPNLQQPAGLLLISEPKAASWNREIHELQGNIALADGSVSQRTQKALQQALKDSGLATNRFAVP